MPDIYGHYSGDAQNRRLKWKVIDTDPISGEAVYAPYIALEPLSIGGGGGGGLTDAQLRATPVPVSGPLTDAQLRAVAVPVSGTFWQATQPVSGTFWQTTQPVSGTITANKGGSWVLDTAAKGTTLAGNPTSEATDANTQSLHTRVTNASLAVTGTFWQVTQPVSLAASVNVEGDTAVDAPLANNPVTTGGRASNATPTAVSADADVVVDWQDRRGAQVVRQRIDTNRTRVVIKFHAAATATADTLLSLVRQATGVDAVGATTIAVTANKILRIESIYVGVRAGAAAAAFAEFTFRNNPAGAAVIGSPAWLRIPVGSTGATIGAAIGTTHSIPGGIEFSGTDQIAVSASAQATTNVLSVTMIGYEYDN